MFGGIAVFPVGLKAEADSGALSNGVEWNLDSSDQTFYANWSELAITGLKLISKPTKTEYYAGDTLDTSGLVALAIYEDGTTEEISADRLTYSITEFPTAGKKIVKAYYGEKYVSFIVTVLNGTLTAVSVATLPDKVTYTVGEELDTTGLTLTVTYDNSSIKTVTDGFDASCDLSSAGTKTVTVNYTENGVTVSTLYPITVNPKVVEPDTTISVDSVSVVAGETITVPFRIENNKGFMGFAIAVEYDSEAFTPVSVAPAAILENGTLNDSIGTAYEYLKIVYVGSDDVIGDGDLFTVDFIVNENASGSYTFGVSYLQPDTFNESLDNVVFECSDFEVTVSNSAVDQSVIFSGGFVEATAGTTVNVPVSVKNGIGINSFSFKINYNSDLMSFVGVSNGAALADGKISSSVNTDNEILLDWFGSPITSDGELFYVTFEIDGYVQSEEILAVLCDNVAFVNGTEKDIICSDAHVDISNPNGGDTPVVYSKDYLRIEESVIEVPVYIKNNHGIMGFGMNFEYDSSVLTPLGVTADSLLSAGYFVNNIGSKDGSFKVLWNHTENIYGNGLLFTIRFSVAEEASPATVPLTVTYSQPDTYNEDWEDVALNTALSEIGISYIYTATFMFNGEIIGTDEFRPDDDSLDYPEVEQKPYYEWVWDEHALIAQDITVEGRYVPVEYLISYYNGNVLVATDKYTIETLQEQIVLPEVPVKEGYSGEWESFELGTSDIDVHCIYTLNVYTATFIYNGEVIGTDKFTVEDNALDCPQTEAREHYEWVWDDYEISGKDITVEGRYVPVEYTITFTSNGKTVKTQVYTVETQDSVSPPQLSLPAKEGYYSEWEDWTGKIGNLTVNEIYVAEEYTIYFYCECRFISQIEFTVETELSQIELPEIPDKSGYSGVWENFAITASDIEVNCIYTPVVYKATFMSDGKVIGTDTFTVEDEVLDYPYVEKREGYDWVWDKHSIEADNITVEGRYVPIEYTITFVSNGKIIETRGYNVETLDLIVPPAKSLPVKQHYTSEWESWSGKTGNITVNEIYVPVKYTASFYFKDNLVATRSYTVETQTSNITIPAIPEEAGYTIRWPEFTFAYRNQSIYAVYTPVTYSAKFYVDGKLFATRSFTVETEKLNEPLIPQKPGFIASWSGYVIGPENLIIHAKYYPPEVVVKEKITLKVDETYRLIPLCNFEASSRNWSSSNPAVATVDGHGNITAVGKGECKITVVCYGKDSSGNDIKATGITEIKVKEQINAQTFKEIFRAAFDEFFSVKLHDIAFNFKKFIIILLRYAY